MRSIVNSVAPLTWLERGGGKGVLFNGMGVNVFS